MNSFTLPSTMDCAPEFCFCGRKTVESHDFWFCSTECARQDSLRSLDNPECHYRRVVEAYVRAGKPEPRRMMSADHLRRDPSTQRSFAHPHLPFTPPKNFLFRGNAAGFPTLSQVTGKILTKKAARGEPLATERHDRPRWEAFQNASSSTRPVRRPDSHTFEQPTLDDTPLPEHVPARTLRRVPSSIDGLRNNITKNSVVTMSNFRRTGKEGENPERTFGQAIGPVIPLVGNGSLPSHPKMSPTFAVPTQATKALRRSASFSGWNSSGNSAGGPVSNQDLLMHIIEEMREELSESFDPRSLFDQEEDY